MNVLLHSYSFRDHKFEDACQCAAECGYDGVELQRVHFDEDRLTQELPERIATAKEHGTRISCVDFTADFMQTDTKARAAQLARLEQTIHTCADHDIHLLNGHTGVLLGGAPEDFAANGSAAAEDRHYLQARNALRLACEAAEHAGVTISLEIHMNTLHDTIASATRLLDEVDSHALACTLDIGNQQATPQAENATEGIESLKGRIGIVHLKNCRGNDPAADFSVPLDEGDIDLPGYVRFLGSIGYTGPVCIEHVGRLPAYETAKRDRTAFAQWLQAI